MAKNILKLSFGVGVILVVCLITKHQESIWILAGESLTAGEQAVKTYTLQLNPNEAKTFLKSKRVEANIVHDCKRATSGSCTITGRINHYDTYKVTEYQDGAHDAVILFSGTGK